MRYILICLMIALASCSRKVYVVRHAEKAVSGPQTEMVIDASNPPLSEAGEERALDLKKLLGRKNIKYIFSTKYERNMATARPLAEARNITIKQYDASPSEIGSLQSSIEDIEDGNVLIVGHSNTVDDIVNTFTNGKFLTDLAETEYDNLFILKRKKGKWVYVRKRYGK